MTSSQEPQQVEDVDPHAALRDAIEAAWIDLGFGGDGSLITHCLVLIADVKYDGDDSVPICGYSRLYPFGEQPLHVSLGLMDVSRQALLKRTLGDQS